MPGDRFPEPTGLREPSIAGRRRWTSADHHGAEALSDRCLLARVEGVRNDYQVVALDYLRKLYSGHVRGE